MENIYFEVNKMLITIKCTMVMSCYGLLLMCTNDLHFMSLQSNDPALLFLLSSYYVVHPYVGFHELT